MIFLTRCGECDESWCNACEGECPTCLVGAGIETGVLKCSHCEAAFCRECVWSWECPDCLAVICGTCWHSGLDCGCHANLDDGDAEDELPSQIELPPGFHLVPDVNYPPADRKAWRADWARRQKPKPWRNLDPNS